MAHRLRNYVSFGNFGKVFHSDFFVEGDEKFLYIITTLNDKNSTVQAVNNPQFLPLCSMAQ